LLSAPVFKELKQLDDNWEAERKKFKKTVVPWLDHVVRKIDYGLQVGEEKWRFNNSQGFDEFQVTIQKEVTVDEELMLERFQGTQIESRLFFWKLILSNPQVSFSVQERSDNFFTIRNLEANLEFEFFIQPKGSSWKRMDLTSDYFNKDKASKLILDPPWILAGSNPVRGPAINYKTMTMQEVLGLKITDFQQEGLLALWVINSSYVEAMNWLQDFGYEIKHELHWIKLTRHANVSPSIGHYLQHSTETCVLASKGNYNWEIADAVNKWILPATRKFQSQKPWKVHELMEDSIKGLNVELFGRAVNLRNKWMTIGDQVTPDDDECWIYYRDTGMVIKSGGVF